MKINSFKRTIILAGVIVSSVSALIGGGRVFAWGPERTTYTMANPAESATFNSITDNAAVGDERDFVRIVKVETKEAYSNEVILEDGAEYEVYIYYHNDASSTYNKKEYDYKGLARETRLASAFPVNVKSGERAAVSGTISSSTTTPEKVWDEAYVKAEDGKEFNLAYKEGSAKIYNDWEANGSTLSTAMFSEKGTFLGLDELDGLILGCDEFSGQVVYKLVATEVKRSQPEPEVPKFYIEKRVSLDGGKSWREAAEVKPGDVIEFRIKFENVGTTALKNVYAYDTLDMATGMEYIPGSTRVSVINGNLTGVEDGIFANGVSLGKFEAGETAEVRYRVKISEDTGKFACGETVLYNGAAVSFGSEDWKGSEDSEEDKKGGMATQYDKVKITVKRDDCTPEELPETGPAEIILAIIVVLGIGAGGAYYLSSRKMVKKLEKKVKE